MFIRTIILFFSLLIASTSFAAGKPFDQATFDQARKDGKPILVMIHADWCPTCRAQGKVVDNLAAKLEFATFQILRVDYDKQKGFVSVFKVPRQSSLIVYKGKTEVARSTGETSEDMIAAMMRKAL